MESSEDEKAQEIANTWESCKMLIEKEAKEF